MIDFTCTTMKIELDYPESHLQKCPCCGMGHPMYINGYSRDYHTERIVIHPNRGYSFCNCKNLWYTDWKNINQEEYNEVERSKTANASAKYNKTIVFTQTIMKLKNFHSSIKSFLNIGGGSLFIEDLIREHLGWETTGVDINPTLANAGHNLICGDIEQQETLDKLGTYDVIWASHVLEHLHYPIKTLENLKKKLNPGGIFYITLPDPFFFNPNNPSSFAHWWTHQHHQIWNMDNFVEEVFALNYIIKVSTHEPNVLAKEFHVLAANPTAEENKFIELTRNKIDAKVPINIIASDDQGHKIDNIDKEHREGADIVKKLIQEGKEILPIACTYYGRRTDGFKRYIAYKELGYETIDVVINNTEGCQHKQPWVISSKS